MCYQEIVAEEEEEEESLRALVSLCFQLQKYSQIEKQIVVEPTHVHTMSPLWEAEDSSCRTRPLSKHRFILNQYRNVATDIVTLDVPQCKENVQEFNKSLSRRSR